MAGINELSGLEDEDIRRLLAKGQTAPAFDLLVDRYQNRVFRLALSFLRDRAKAEDVAQDAFLKLWRALRRYDGRATLSTWIYTIARNTCLNQIRRDSYRIALSLDAAGDVADSRSDASPTTKDCTALLEALPEKNRQVLTLFYLQEKSYEEVAEMLNMPLGTVKSHLHRAKRMLAAMLKP